MTSNSVGISWVNNVAEASAYSWLENLAQFNSSGHCPQTGGNTNQKNVTAYLNANNVLPWVGMRRCNITKSGVITNFQNNSATGCNYTDTPTTPATQVGWTLPGYYYWTYHKQTTLDANTYRWFISPDGTGTINGMAGGSMPSDSPYYGEVFTPTWKYHPAFIRNTVSKPYLVLGAYEGHTTGSGGSQILNSTAEVLPTTNLLCAGARTYAQNIGSGLSYNGWGQQDFLSRCAVQLAYLIECGGFNSRLLIGTGIGNLSSETHRGTGVRTGWTSTLAAANGGTNLGNLSGLGVAFTDSTIDGLYVADTAVSGNQAVSYRGLENPWGNIEEWLDGLNVTNYIPWVADNSFAVDTFTAPYTSTGFTLPAGGWATDIAVSPTFDYTFIPSAASGGGYTVKLAYYYSNPGASTNFLGTTSWSWNSGMNNTDMMFLHFVYTSANYLGSVGGRIMYIPQ